MWIFVVLVIWICIVLWAPPGAPAYAPRRSTLLYCGEGRRQERRGGLLQYFSSISHLNLKLAVFRCSVECECGNLRIWI